MSQKNSTHSHLKIIADVFDIYFEKDVVQFLLSRLNVENLKNKEYITSITNWRIETDLVGYVQFVNADRVYLDVLPDSHKLFSTRADRYEQWKELLEEKQSGITQSSNYLINSSENTYNVSINLILALLDVKKYHTLLAQNSAFALTSEEGAVFVEDLLRENQSYKYFGGENKEMFSWMCDLVAEHMNTVRKRLKITEETLIGRVFKSEGFKKLLVSAEQKDIASIFSEEHLSAIMSRSNLKETLKEKPYLLSGVMPIAPPEAWINSKLKDKTGSIVDLFSPLLSFASGITKQAMKDFLSKGIRCIKPVSTRGLLELKNRLEYLGPALEKMEFSTQDRIEWYTHIMQLANYDLAKISLQFVPLPETDNKFFSPLVTTKNLYNASHESMKKSEKMFSLIECRNVVLKEKLENKLDSQTMPVKRVVKI